MIKIEAKKLIGKKATYFAPFKNVITGNIIRIDTACDNDKLVIAELDTGLIVNIDLLKIENE